MKKKPTTIHKYKRFTLTVTSLELESRYFWHLPWPAALASSVASGQTVKSAL